MQQIADEAFQTYEMYVEEDRRAGNFCDDDYAQHPAVHSIRDTWRVLKPLGLTITSDSKEHDAMIWLDVDWPNPHYFVAYIKNSNLYVLDVDG
jgi:hypothetical protein